MARVLVEIDVRCCMYLALKYPSGTTMLFTVCGSVYWACVCVEESRLCSRTGFLEL